MGKKNSFDEFSVTTWNKSIGRAPFLKIRNEEKKFTNPDSYIEMDDDVLDVYFGKDEGVPEHFLCFRNAQNNIVGFTGITDFGRTAKTPSIWYSILPTCFKSSLPQIVIDASITLAKESRFPKIYLITAGTLNPFDKILENRGFFPFHYSWLMKLETLDTQILEKRPNGVEFFSTENFTDFDNLALVYNQAFRNHFEWNNRAGDEYKKNLSVLQKHFELAYFLASIKNEKVGYSYITINKVTNTGTIAGLGVLPEYQKRGIGGALLGMTVMYLHDKGVSHIQLGVDGENEKAMDLYIKYGFQVEEHRILKYYDLKSDN